MQSRAYAGGRALLAAVAIAARQLAVLDPFPPLSQLHKSGCPQSCGMYLERELFRAQSRCMQDCSGAEKNGLNTVHSLLEDYVHSVASEGIISREMAQAPKYPVVKS